MKNRSYKNGNLIIRKKIVMIFDDFYINPDKNKRRENRENEGKRRKVKY